MFILISLWGIVSCIPGATSYLPWKESKAVVHLRTNALVTAAGLQRGRGAPDFLGFLINGAQAREIKNTIKETKVASFLNRLSELITSGNLNEATRLAGSTSVEETQKDFRHYCTFLRYAFEQKANINVEMVDIQNNVYEIRIFAKRYIDSNNKTVDELVFRNGRLTELNGYPITAQA